MPAFIRPALVALALCGVLACHPYHRIADLRGQAPTAGLPNAQEVLEACAQTHFPHGLPRSATVAIHGEWSSIAHALQPELCDRHWRGPSVQTYDFAAGTTHQRYDNDLGVKEVFWNRYTRDVSVTRAGKPDTREDARRCAALVAESYPLFLAGPGLFPGRVADPVCVGQAEVDLDSGGRENCWLVAADLRPGLGLCESDAVVLWIGRDSHRLHKMQMTLRGFEPTRTAEVAVSFLAWRRDDGGNLWPSQTSEYLYRPAPKMVYEWRTRVESTERD